MTSKSELVEIRGSSIHGLGGFATADIAAGTLVLEYRGEKINKTESRRRCAESNHFIFSLDDDCDIDGSTLENLARFLNHSCAPNCEAQRIAGQIWIVAVRRIRSGEEITFNYGYELASYREHPCCCGTSDCVGYIVAEELFEAVRSRSEDKELAVR